VSGCAQVTIRALNSDGTVSTDKAKGLRYYTPRPYLLVMRLPPEKSASEGQTQDLTPPPAQDLPPAHRTRPGQPVAPRPGAGAADADASTKPTSPSGQQNSPTPYSTTSSPPTDTGYLASNSQYVAKLIYLPNLAEPLAVTATTGIGSVNIGAVLQDGWMLTSLQAGADAKVAETITALAALASAIGGAVVGKPPTAAATPPKPTGAGPPPSAPSPPTPPLLTPGLYTFRYVDGYYSLCAASLFEPRINPSPPDCSQQPNVTSPKTTGWLP
jgi:hypothetical protein